MTHKKQQYPTIKFIAVILLFAGYSFTGCEGLDNDVGPCIHVYEEPSLTIESVTDADTGEEITGFSIHDIHLDSEIQSPSFLLDQHSLNAVLQDSLITCEDTPCGFGTKDGTYEFTVKASGYQDTQITAEAGYDSNEGGCPSRSFDGHVIDFVMNSEM